MPAQILAPALRLRGLGVHRLELLRKLLALRAGERLHFRRRGLRGHRQPGYLAELGLQICQLCHSRLRLSIVGLMSHYCPEMFVPGWISWTVSAARARQTKAA